MQARYTLDYMFDTIVLGLPKFYIYELFDDQADPNSTNIRRSFWPVTSTATPKAAATAIHNLMTILNGIDQYGNLHYGRDATEWSYPRADRA